VHLAFDYLGLPRYPGQPHFLMLSIAQMVLVGLLVAALFVVLRPLENDPLPLWDGGDVAARGARSAAVGSLLSIAGAATLASVGWGLKEQGLVCVSAMLLALIGARGLANQGVTAAALLEAKVG
jgi:hypothetical protein